MANTTTVRVMDEIEMSRIFFHRDFLYVKNCLGARIKGIFYTDLLV